MFKTLRTLGIAAIVAAALPAQAALTPVKLDFNLTPAGPVPLLPYAGAAYGNTTFAGNTAYIEDQSGNGVLTYGCTANCTPEDQLIISVGSLFTGKVSFDYSFGSPVLFQLYDANSVAVGTGSTLSGTGAASVDLTGVWVKYLVFDVTFGTVNIDNLEFFIDAGTPSVPEPASVALVALALAGAGSVLRRKPR